MLNTKYVLMLVVLSAGMLTGLTGTGVSQVQPAFADKERVCEDNSDNNCNDQTQKIEQENNCKIENKNDDGDNSVRDNQNELTCWNFAQNPNKADASVNDDAFSGLNN